MQRDYYSNLPSSKERGSPIWAGQGPGQLTKLPRLAAGLTLSPHNSAITFKHCEDCIRPDKLTVSDPRETDSQALVPELALQSPGKEYNALFSLTGRLPKGAAEARRRQRHWVQGRGLLPGEVWLEGGQP